jgi:hypothetical protein
MRLDVHTAVHKMQRARRRPRANQSTPKLRRNTP